MNPSNFERSQQVIQNIVEHLQNNANILTNNFWQRERWVGNLERNLWELQLIITSSNDFRQAYKIHLQMIHTEVRNVLINERSIQREITRLKGDNPLFQVD